MDRGEPRAFLELCEVRSAQQVAWQPLRVMISRSGSRSTRSTTSERVSRYAHALPLFDRSGSRRRLRAASVGVRYVLLHGGASTRQSIQRFSAEIMPAFTRARTLTSAVATSGSRALRSRAPAGQLSGSAARQSRPRRLTYALPCRDAAVERPALGSARSAALTRSARAIAVGTYAYAQPACAHALCRSPSGRAWGAGCGSA